MPIQRNECLEFARQNIEASREAAKEYDSRMFWLAGGAIALSAAFVQRLLESRPTMALPALLGLGWLLLLSGVVLVLQSFQIAGALYEQWINYWTCKMDTDIGDPDLCRAEALRIGKRAALLNRWSLRMILAGLAVLSAFVFMNLLSEPQGPVPLVTHTAPVSTEATTSVPSTVTTMDSAVTVLDVSRPQE